MSQDTTIQAELSPRPEILKPRLPHPNTPIPEDLPGYLHAPTVAWFADQLEEVERFWRQKAIVHPKSEPIQQRLTESRRRVMWLRNIAAYLSQQVAPPSGDSGCEQ